VAVRWISAVALMAAVVTGCGDDDGGLTAADLEAVDQAVDTLVASGFSRGSAQCYVEGMIATFGIDEISAIGGGVPVSPEVTDRAAELLDECGVFTDLTSTTVASGNTGATFGDYRDTALPRDQVDGPADLGRRAMSCSSSHQSDPCTKHSETPAATVPNSNSTARPWAIDRGRVTGLEACLQPRHTRSGLREAVRPCGPWRRSP